MGAFDDLLPAAAPAAARGGAGLFDDLIPQKEQIGTIEGYGRGVGKGFATTGKMLSAAASAPAVIADAVASLFTGRTVTGAQDFMFGLSAPAMEAPKFYDLDPATQEYTTGGKIGNVAGNLTSSLVQMAAMPGAVPAGTGRLAAAAVRARQPVEAAKIVGRHALLPSFVKGAPMTVAQPLETASRVLEAGGPTEDAMKAAAVESAINTAAVALPLSASGSLGRRVTTGAAMGAPVNLGQQAVSNKMLEAYPQLQQDVMSPENLATQTALPALLAALFGPRAGPAPRQPAPPAPPPDISGNVVPAAEKTIAQIIAERVGIPQEGPRAAYDSAQSVGERAIAQQEINKQRSQRGRELGQTFRGYPGELPPDPNAAVPATRDAAIREAYEGVGTTPESVSTAFRRAILARDGVMDLPEAQRDVTARENTRTMARGAFDIAEQQAARKQDAQDMTSMTAEPRDLRDASAAGTTTPEGTAAVQPEAFTFLDIQRKGGKVTGTGPQVEIVRELTAKDAKGNDVPAYEVRYQDANGETRTEIVEARRVGELSRPANPRFAQDQATQTYAPARGVGTGKQQPQPRRAAQRITTGPSPELLGTDALGRPADPPRQPETIDGESSRVGPTPLLARPGIEAPKYTVQRPETPAAEPVPDAAPIGPAEDVAAVLRAAEKPPFARTAEDVMVLRRYPDLADAANTPGFQRTAEQRALMQRATRESTPPTEPARAPETTGVRDEPAEPVMEQARAEPVEADPPVQGVRGEADPGPTRADTEPPAAPVRKGRKKTPIQDERLNDPEYTQAVEALAKGAGWDEKGGRLLRDETDPTAPVIGRTSWAASEWWTQRPADARLPGDTEGNATREAVRKALAGEALGEREKRAVRYMLDRMGDEIETGRVAREEARLEQEGKMLADARPEEEDSVLFDFGREMGKDEADAFFGYKAADDSPQGQRAAGREGDTGTYQRTGEVRGENERADPAQERTTDQPRRDSGPTGDDFGLRGETPDELRARDARQRLEAEQQSARDKAPDADSFRLSGSDRAADEAAARGQMELDERQPGVFRSGDRVVVDSRDGAVGVVEGRGPKTVYVRIGKKLHIVQPSKVHHFDGEGGGTLYANPIGPMFGWAKQQASAWRESIGDFADLFRGSGKKSNNTNAVRAFFDTAVGEMGARVDKSGSKTAKWVYDQFAARTGMKDATGETVQAAMGAYTNARLTELDRLLRPFEKDKASREQIASLVRNPKTLRAGTPLHDAAIGIRNMLDDALKYMRDAGVEIGEVREGYYPREFVAGEVTKDSKAFIDAATQAYRENGMSTNDARLAASELYDSIAFGQTNSLFRPGAGQGTPFVKSRVFGKQVDVSTHPLNRFLENDPMVALGHYFDRAGKRAEIAKRFGDNFSNWEGMARKIRAEGGGDILESLMDFVQIGAGVKRTGGGWDVRVSSALRTWGALMFLEKAVLSSLPEVMMPAIRAGRVSDIPKALSRTIADLAGTLKGAERRAFAEDLGLLTGHMMDSLQVARFVGDNPASHAQHMILAKYFRRTGLTQWTEATTVASADMGRVFLRRLSMDMEKGGKLTQRYLAELGVPADKAADFANYVRKFGNRMPGAGDLKGDMGDLYRAAIRRFSQQSIMRPDQTLRPSWMSTPLGSVIGQLQSFNYAFFENVLKRNYRLAKDAVKNDGGYTTAERLEMLKPMMMLPLLAAGAFVIGEGRDAMLGDKDRRQEETGTDKALKALSRGVPIAPIDPILNLLTSAKYNSSALTAIAGPVIGTGGKGVDAMLNLMSDRNSDNTNTSERRAAKAAYDVLVEPTLNVLMYAVPAGPLLSPAASAATVAGIPMARNKFVDEVAGEKKQRQSSSY